MKKVTVIVPVYNVEKYLPKCIESILTQSYNEIELILINDGSNDRSGNICDVYAAQDTRIKVIHQENRGLSGARNAGLDIAQGDYIGFVDSDDYVDPNMYTLMVQAIENSNADLVACTAVIVSESGRFIRNLTKKCKSISRLSRKEALLVFPSTNVISNSACDKLFSASIIKNIKFDPKIRVSEDNPFVCEVLVNINSIILIPNQLYFYVMRKESITNSDFNSKNLDVIEAEKKCIKLYEKNQPDLVKLMTDRFVVGMLHMLVVATEKKTTKNNIDTLCFELNKYKDYKFSGRFIDHIKIFVYFKLNSIKLMLLLKKIKRIINWVFYSLI